ncbi:MAG: universal stress protein [Thermodesulfobacteriota bacterium]
MKILAVCDDHPTSERIVAELAHIAANTWADVIMLGVQQPGNGNEPDPALASRLLRCRDNFIRFFPATESPYGPCRISDAFVSFGRGRWLLAPAERKGESRKKLTVRIRAGNPVREILSESRLQEVDLIILGCSLAGDCRWLGGDLRRKIASRAGCAVLVIRDLGQPPGSISCFVGQGPVSQASLEMINQIATVHQTDLSLVGLVGNELSAAGEERITQRMAGMLRYYAQRRIPAWIRLALPENVEEDVRRAGRDGIIALLLGKKSLFGGIFPDDLIGRLVSGGQPAVLILR